MAESLQDIKEFILLTPRTTSCWLLIIITSILFVHSFQLSWWMAVLLPYIALLVCEISAFTVFHKDIFFVPAERVSRSYEWLLIFLEGHKNGDLEKTGDLTEGYFDGNFEKTMLQAVSDKYEKIISLLGLKKGDRVLDVGCGLGDMLDYFKTKHGIDGVGLTLSPDQQRICLDRGLDVRVCDFRNSLPQDMLHQFDAVILLGSLEHFVSFSAWKNQAHVDQVYRNVFISAFNCLSEKSRVRKIFSSTMHQKVDYQYSLRDYLHAYLLQGHYCGYYPVEGDFERLCYPELAVAYKYDSTVDYQYTSIMSAHHFGNFKINWTTKKFFYLALSFVVNPFTPTTWLYHYFKTWMWQFGGVTVVEENKRPFKTLWYVHQPASDKA